MEEGTLILHHLNASRSQRTLWQLAEMGHPYKVVLHERQADKRAPPSLYAVDSLGRSPVLELPSGRKIIESGAISAYLCKYYDKPTPTFADPDWIREEQLASFAESSIDSMFTIVLICDFAGSMSPWFIRPLVKAIFGGINGLIGKDVKKQLTWLESQLGDNNWFNGGETDNPGRADFLLVWHFDLATQRKWYDLDKEYPKLGKWYTRCHARPAWKQALNEGNGYNLASF